VLIGPRKTTFPRYDPQHPISNTLEAIDSPTKCNREKGDRQDSGEDEQTGEWKSSVRGARRANPIPIYFAVNWYVRIFFFARTTVHRDHG